MFNGCFGAHHAEFFDRIMNFGGFAQPGGINQYGGAFFAVELDRKVNIHRIAGGAGYIAGDHAFFAQQRIDQTGLSNIGASDNGDPQRFDNVLFFSIFFGKFIVAVSCFDRSFQIFRKLLKDFFHKIIYPVTVQTRNRCYICKTPAGKLHAFFAKRGIVTFVGCYDDRFSGGAQFFGYRFIHRDNSLLDIDYHDQYIGIGNGLKYLSGNVFIPLVNVARGTHGAQTAGINKLKMLTVETAGCSDTVAGHAALLMHDCHTSADDRVEQTRFADVRSADDGDHRLAGSAFVRNILIIAHI